MMARLFKNCLLPGCAAVLACAAECGPAGPEGPALRELLGPEAERARFVASCRERLVLVDLRSLTPKVLGEYPGGGKFGKLSRPRLSPDGRRVVFSHLGRGYTIDADGRNRQPLPAGRREVYDPDWWRDPETAELCVVFATANGKFWYKGDTASPGATCLLRPRSGEVERLAGFPCDGGLSLDGTHLGEAYGGCLMVHLPSGTYHKLYDGRQSCNATMSPDNTYRLMHLYLPHSRFGVRDKWDRELWRIEKPDGSDEWQTPRWSNHPRYCMATAKFGPDYVPVVIDMQTGRTVVLHSLGGGWRAPHLWLPSGAALTSGPAGPLAHLPLQRLIHYREKVARARCYTPVLRELRERRGHPEADRIVATLERLAADKLAAAAAAQDPRDAQALYREVAERYAGLPPGNRAASTLASDEFRRKVEAARLGRELEARRQRLRRPAGLRKGDQLYTNPAYFKANQPLLVQMARLAARLRAEHPGTAAARRAARLAARYALPADVTAPGNVRLVVEATVSAASNVPTAAQIAPYTEALTSIEYRVEKVIAGAYDRDSLLVVAWGMREGRHTPAASWPPGRRQRLTLDLFEAHADLQNVTLAQDAVSDPTLTPYWLIEHETVDGAAE